MEIPAYSSSRYWVEKELPMKVVVAVYVAVFWAILPGFSQVPNCLPGDWWESKAGLASAQNAFVWSITAQHSTIDVRRNDGFVFGSFVPSGQNQWAGSLHWGNGDVWNNVALYFDSCSLIRTNKSWWYRRGPSSQLTALPSQPSRPSCDPNWSPKFSQINILGFDSSPASVRQITDQQVAKYGGVAQSIREVESEEVSYRQQLVQQQNDGNADGVNQVQQLIQFSDGMLDILRCRQQIASQASSVAPGPSGSAAGAVPSGNARSTTSPPAQIDVRYLQVDSRPLTDAEMRDLRNSLRWEPDSYPLSPGGAASSNLVDDKGRKLGSVRVWWDKTGNTKTATTLGHFRIQVENATSCVLQSSAELEDNQGFVVVSAVTWGRWLTLHQPEPNQVSLVEGSATMNQSYPSLVLKPLTADSTLSACMTPKTP